MAYAYIYARLNSVYIGFSQPFGNVRAAFFIGGIGIASGIEPDPGDP